MFAAPQGMPHCLLLPFFVENLSLCAMGCVSYPGRHGRRFSKLKTCATRIVTLCSPTRVNTGMCCRVIARSCCRMNTCNCCSLGSTLYKCGASFLPVDRLVVVSARREPVPPHAPVPVVWSPPPKPHQASLLHHHPAARWQSRLAPPCDPP